MNNKFCRHAGCGVRYFICALLLLPALIYFPSQFLVEEYMRFKMRNQHIVVSFTTTPYRIDKLSKTIQNILEQNVHINQIYLSIPHKFKRDNLGYIIPEYLQNNENIHILRTEDYGPATKLLGLLANVKLPNNSIIITIDDDTPYPNNLVLQLAYKALQNPDKAVGLSGAVPDYDKDGLINTKQMLGLIKINNNEQLVSVLQGFAGIAYRSSFFDADIFDILDYPQACINSDDLYLSFYLARKNIPRTNLWNNYISPKKIDWYNDISSAKDSLHKIEWPADKYRACLAFMQNKYPNIIL